MQRMPCRKGNEAGAHCRDAGLPVPTAAIFSVI
jgi:hypothetical protein